MLVTSCRICGFSRLTPVLDLGHTPPADDFLTLAQLSQPETYYPLKVVVCDNCHLAQLTYTVPREKLYQGDYPYISSTTSMGVQHYHDMAREVDKALILHNPCSPLLAVDIGSNVGVLLDGFKSLNYDVLGIEPASHIAEMANLRGIPTINDFFSHYLASRLNRQAHVITGTNVVAHIDNLDDLARGIYELLHPQGIFVFEAPYLVDLIDNCAYDTIYHEHLSYLSVIPVQYWLSQYDLELFHVEHQSIHGGTLRYYIAHNGAYHIKDSVADHCSYEMRALYDASHGSLYTLASAANSHALTLRNKIHHLASHSSIAAISAPAKGMTLLQYTGIAPYLRYVTEKAPLKLGKYTPGTHLLIKEDNALDTDCALLLAWNFADEISSNLRRGGYKGRIIVPMPTLREVD